MGHFVEGVEFEVHTCGDCGVMWAMTTDYVESRRVDHKNFYCPNGHSWHYPQKTPAEKLQDKLTNTEIRLKTEIQCCIEAREETNALERSLRTTKGHVTRMKNQAKGE